MSKTAVGIVTFGNAAFTRLGLVEILKTVKKPVSIVLVIGKPGDTESLRLADEFQLPRIVHQENKGFPASINDIYDWAWIDGNFDNLIIMGNDVVPYPNAIDALIEEADTSDHVWVSSCQFDVRSLLARYPEAGKYFKGPNCEFTDFTARPWELHGPEHIRAHRVEGGVIKDVHNLCLFKREVFERIGYIDVNFFPAYFSDNDYCMRGTFEGLKTCSLDHSAYFHFWSRTVHQEKGSVHTPRYFQANSDFYRLKWGGPVQGEKFTVPFNGNDFRLTGDLWLPGSRTIRTREGEEEMVRYWKARG